MTCLKTVNALRILSICHLFDGNLAVYLWNNSATRATAHYCFSIVNEEDYMSAFAGDRSTGDSSHSKPVLFEGTVEELFPAVCEDKLGFSLCSAATVNNRWNGFLEYNYFLVRAEIRLKLQDNERWTVSVKRKTATCTVRSTSPSNHFDSWYP